jgi:hypothetical protein
MAYVRTCLLAWLAFVVTTAVCSFGFLFLLGIVVAWTMHSSSHADMTNTARSIGTVVSLPVFAVGSLIAYCLTTCIFFTPKKKNTNKTEPVARDGGEQPA